MPLINPPTLASSGVNRLTAWGCAAVVAVSWALFLYMGAAGLDRLRHWDEDLMVAQVESSIANRGVLLPASYNYPSASYWVAGVAFAPEVVGEWRRAGAITEAGLLRRTRSETFRLRLRALYLLIASLTIPVVCAAGWLAAGPAAGALSAVLIASSWEVAYHARWPAPDALVMLCAAIALWLVALSARRGSALFWRAAAVAAGAAVASKYSAWLLVPIVMAAHAVCTGTRRRRIPETVTLGVLSVVTFLVITPGSILQPLFFVRDMLWESRHYSTGHPLHTVAGFGDHLAANLTYLAAVAWSPWAPAALVVTAGAIPGAAFLARRTPGIAIVAVGYPVCYLAFLSTYHVMIARNLLHLLPLLAVVIAVGVIGIVAAIRAPVWRLPAIALLTLVVGGNQVYIARAAASRGADAREAAWGGLASDAAAGVLSTACATPRARALLRTAALPEPPAVPCGNASHVLFLPQEIARDLEPPELELTRVYGPLEVNYEYYPDWEGTPVLLMARWDRLPRLTGQD